MLKNSNNRRVVTFCYQPETWQLFISVLVDFFANESRCCVGLNGDLGAGKTFLVRELLNALGIEEVVKSPTFSIIESYQVGGTDVHHIDCYRLSEMSHLVHIGYEPSDPCLSFIEWSDRLPELDQYLDIEIHINDSIGRQYQIAGLTPIGEQLINRLEDQRF